MVCFGLMMIGARVILPADSVKKYADTDAKNSAYEVQFSGTTSVNISLASEEPVASQQTYIGTGISNDNFVTYTVQKGDTVFGIVNKFGTTLEKLIELNPNISNGLAPNMVLKLKKAEKNFTKKSNNVLNIAIMLPFGYEENDSKLRTLSTEFLAGAKLAIERYARQGLAMDILVIDAGNETSFKKALQQINKDNTDLVVGPFFKSNVVETMQYLEGSGIPVVVPFADAEELHNYKNLIIASTNERFYLDKMVDEVRSVFKDQKIAIVDGGNTAQAERLKNQLQKSLKKAQIKILQNPEDILPEMNGPGNTSPIISILLGTQDKTASQFVDAIIEIANKTQGSKAFSTVYDVLFEKKNDALGITELVYFMDKKINEEGDFEKEILAEFKNKYCSIPSKFVLSGFDVMHDILSRENTKGELLKNMKKENTQLGTKFNYIQTKNNGAFVNTAFRIVRLKAE